MDGAHDMGGMHGFGPINPEDETEEPIFHAEWERRVLAFTLATGMLGKWNIDMSRHARERQDPATYLANSYYETWTAGLETLLQDTGLLTAEELETGRPAGPTGETAADVVRAKEILATGGPTLLDAGGNPAFAVGERVRVLDIHTAGHTRAPRYIRNRTGTVHAYHGVHVFADANAHGEKRGEPLYNVRFDGRDLWGDDGSANSVVHVDLWEPHLEAAG